jgi:hypothetical protein
VTVVINGLGRGPTRVARPVSPQDDEQVLVGPDEIGLISGAEGIVDMRGIFQLNR